MHRFPTNKVVDYCFRPIHVKDEYRDILVPCGKCEGCRLHKANDWSLRLQDEIENCPNSIFFTLTYNNKYLPKLKLVKTATDNDGLYRYWYISDHPDNIRFNSVVDVSRNEGLSFSVPFAPIPIQNSDFVGINYASKTDIQLWLKLLRQKLYEQFYFIYENEDRENRGFFRYYIISEVGPTTFRNHYHGIIFPKRREYAEVLCPDLLYSCWQMCDEGLFKQHTAYCNSATAQYVTNYTTGFANIPEVYQEVKDIRPFRLASKAPSIGYGFYDKEEVLSSLLRGDFSYVKSIPRLGASYVFRYSKNYAATLFPKCYEYGSRSFPRIYLAYACLFISVRKLGYRFDIVSRQLREVMHIGDYAAALACYKYVTTYKSCVEHYLYLVDSYYYHQSMNALRQQYSYLSTLSDLKDVMNYYVNFYEFVTLGVQGFGDYSVSLWYFLNSFGIEFEKASDLLKRKYYNFPSDAYQNEVKSIIQDCLKMPKFNELTGNSPHIV